MRKRPDVLWLSVSPYLKCFDQRLMSHLVKHSSVRRWKYCQTIDEPCSVDGVVSALHSYLVSRSAMAGDQPLPKVHLMGHGVSGVVGLLYARKYPQYVASLTLLSVSSMPAVNWQAHYYALRKLLPCSREIILGQMTKLLFGQQAPRFTTALAQLLAKDLDGNLTLHSLAHSSHIAAGGVEIPMLVCNGAHDDIVAAQQQMDWSQWLKPEDKLWNCPEGRHFFHFHHYKVVAKTIMDYWRQLPTSLAALPTQSPEKSMNQTASSENLSLCPNQ